MLKINEDINNTPGGSKSKLPGTSISIDEVFAVSYVTFPIF